MENNNTNQTPNQPQSSGKAIATLVLGILAIVFGFAFFPIGIILGIVAIALYVSAKKEMEREGKGGKGMAVGGLVCGIIGLIISVIYTIITVIGLIFLASFPY